MTRALPIFIGVLLLTACGGASAPTTEAPPTEVPPTDAPAEAQATEVPADTPAPAADPFAPVADAILSRAGNTEVAAATLFRLLQNPVERGVHLVFQFQDQVQGDIDVFCTGYAFALDEEGTYSIGALAASCNPTRPEDPITSFTPREATPFAGGEESAALIVYGEIYSAEVVAVRVFHGDEQNEAAFISGGGWYAALPPEAEISRVVAYNAAGDPIFESELTSRPQ